MPLAWCLLALATAYPSPHVGARAAFDRGYVGAVDRGPRQLSCSAFGASNCPGQCWSDTTWGAGIDRPVPAMACLVDNGVCVDNQALPYQSCANTDGDRVDAFGSNCTWYEEECGARRNRCVEALGYLPSAGIMNAVTDCCVCGGGAVETFLPTSAPTPLYGLISQEFIAFWVTQETATARVSAHTKSSWKTTVYDFFGFCFCCAHPPILASSRAGSSTETGGRGLLHFHFQRAH